MSGSAEMDLRFPIGLLFLLLGTILTVFGVVTNGDTAMYAPSAGVNINLVWGVVLIGFGLVMTGLALRAVTRRRRQGT
ncbi:MAG: hypothetical protein P3B76_13715 [Gemmatimonadota bacterium]|nr:hypothetical protein [Gemmatimonadota bacterium]MDQ8166999.1 hypothetical protein [Gemmatimonadota bacterium]MDQ8173732.1 hypothetical protein [Gemmatimonadota bacterium]